MFSLNILNIQQINFNWFTASKGTGSSHLTALMQLLRKLVVRCVTAPLRDSRSDSPGCSQTVMCQARVLLLPCCTQLHFNSSYWPLLPTTISATMGSAATFASSHHSQLIFTIFFLLLWWGTPGQGTAEPLQEGTSGRCVCVLKYMLPVPNAVGCQALKCQSHDCGDIILRTTQSYHSFSTIITLNDHWTNGSA